MVDIGTEHVAALELVVTEYHRLQTADPDHNLLKYIEEPSVACNKHKLALTNEFIERFSSSPGAPVTAILGTYCAALRRASPDYSVGLNDQTPPIRHVPANENEVVLPF